MVDNIITTEVDHFIEILKTRDKMSITDASRALKTPISVVQSWVDFLVEEKILGIEYKFTKPYVYLNRPEEDKEKEKKSQNKDKETAAGYQIGTFKAEFKDKALSKNIPEKEVHYLWQNHLIQELERKKQFFFIEAKKRDFFNEEDLWVAYKEHLLNA